MAKKQNIKKDAIVNSQLDLKATICTLFTALFASFVLCILAGILFGWTMYKAWIPLLPGFVWPVTPGGFLVGSLWVIGYKNGLWFFPFFVIGYSIYFGILIVYPYNYFLKKKEK